MFMTCEAFNILCMHVLWFDIYSLCFNFVLSKFIVELVVRFDIDIYHANLLQELNNYLSVSTSTSVIIDKSSDGDFLRIDFNTR